MAFKVAALLSIFMLTYIMAPLVITSDIQSSYPISLLVYNSLTNEKNLTFTTNIAYRGILLGAMRKIQTANKNFRFTTKEDPNYGPFLVSVNRLAGDNKKHTYWELLIQPQNGTIIMADVGVGCYIPNPNDTIILKFTKW
ncbi:transcobalamin-1-like [Tachysurus fulvidraco]|uniref:transcobalamin-1-like n=1 Tax=Tachysurus fulvidraco TaxID=1234273 RepID=UPI000F4F0BB3|nr:transcobalamin-1-like [Tachysurus fulvidraco]XP_047676668.1 transcobalamin-1-like [Tachysurus fulvidraco]